MRDLPRFFLPPAQFLGETLVLLDEDANHAARVLRMKEGEALYALDGRGMLYHAEVSAIDKRTVTCRVTGKESAGGELGVPVTLVQGLPKGDKFEWIVQKATELGVSRIVPVVTERSVVRLEGDRALDKVRRWQAIAKEAAEQCERALVPTVEIPVPFRSWLAGAQDGPVTRLACLEREGRLPLARAMALHGAHPAIELVVGPEGGLAPAEGEALVASGAIAVTLGPRILRTETASLAALAIVGSALEA
ncbi:MAG TPA: 16S rRNA (uracil(1498)-N(3))-methyltransferase [Pantanalinema sp.]